MGHDMRKVSILFLFIIFAFTLTLDAQTNVAGDVSGVWELVDSPFIVTGDISITGTNSLEIEPGVEVKFDGFYQFVVYGILHAVGTESEPIIFTSNMPTPSPGDWYNIELADSSIIQYSIIEFAGQPEPELNRFAIKLNGDCEILNNIIRQNNVSGIGAMFESSDIEHNLIYDNSSGFFAGAGIYSQWSSARIINNTIVDNNFAGLWLQANSDSLTVVNNIVANNSGVGFQYDQITGSPFPIADYNNVLGNNPDYMNLTAGTNSISLDPLFIGTEDYHLTEDSPCIDAGDPIFPIDPDGTTSDIGCYPFYQDYEITVSDLSYANFAGSSWITQDQIIDEGDSLNFYIMASDPNGNNLEYEWLLDGDLTSIEDTYSFLTYEYSAGNYEITLFVTDNSGNRNELNFAWNVSVNDVVSLDEEISITSYSLYNFPNPFNPLTTIYFTADETKETKLEIYNLKGQKVKTFRVFPSSKEQSIIWNGKDDNDRAVSSGVYLYCLNLNGKSIIQEKCLLLK